MTRKISGFFMESRIAILGLGLMGGSLALALRGKCARLLGIDPDPSAVKLAVENQIVDLASTEPSTLLPTADIIILAAPVRTIIALLNEIPGFHPGQAVIIDLGSTKEKIIEAMQLLPDRFDPVGGHPICGKEKSSLAFAEGQLYHQAPFIFTTLPRTSPNARLTAEQLALAVGAHPLWLDAPTHDRWVAATSHFPTLLANALAASTPVEAAPLTGPGFQSMTRLAASSPEMMLDIFSTNKDNILSSLHSFQKRLNQIENLLASGEFDQLKELFIEGAERRENIYANKGALL